MANAWTCSKPAIISGKATFTYYPGPCLPTTFTTTGTQTSKPISSSSTTTTTTTTTTASATATSPPISDSSNSPPPTSTTFTDTHTTIPNAESSATSSILPSQQAVSSIHQHTGISSGATAGIAVGCVAAGLIIGLLAALLLLRRRKNSGITDISHDATVFESKTSPLIDNIDGIGSGADIQLGQYLLDGAPDPEIASELQSLGELIHQHVEEIYNPQLVDADIQILSQSLQSLGLGSQGLGLDTEVLATLSSNTNTRHVGLRSVISAVIFASIDFRSQGRLSLLPSPVAGILESMPATEYGGNNALAFSQALSTWRRLSAFLLHPNRSQRTSLQMNIDLVTPQAQLLVNSLNDFLGIFIKPGKEERQVMYLQEVIMECAKFGYLTGSLSLEELLQER
ncbi:hypothetical protein ACHAQJ_007614 [Trichoderma viride]